MDFMHGAARAQAFDDIADMNADFRDGHCVLPISPYVDSGASAGLCCLDPATRFTN